MVANLQAADPAPATGFEDVEIVVGVVESVEKRPVRRNTEPGDGRFTLYGSKEGVPVDETIRARFPPAFVVPAIEVLNVAARITRTARNKDAFAIRSEGQSAPRLHQRKCGDLFLRGEIDDVQGVMRVSGVGEGEELAIGAHLPAEDHVAGLELTAGRSGSPAADQHGVVAVPARHGDVAARDWVFDAVALRGAPDATR